MEENSDDAKEFVKPPAVISEGEAEILLLEKNVFYNPVQEFNRDLRYINEKSSWYRCEENWKLIIKHFLRIHSILVLSAFSKDRRSDKVENADVRNDKRLQSVTTTTTTTNDERKQLQNEVRMKEYCWLFEARRRNEENPRLIRVEIYSGRNRNFGSSVGDRVAKHEIRQGSSVCQTNCGQRYIGQSGREH